MQVADSYHLASGRGHIRAGRFGEPEQGLRSSSCWVLGSRRKQGTALPASLECLFFQLSVLPCVQGALPGGGGARGLALEELKSFMEGQRWRRKDSTAQGARTLPWGKGGAGLVSGELGVWVEAEGIQSWVQCKEVASHITTVHKGE